MAHPTHDGPALDPDQAAALRCLREAFAVGQVTVIDLQPTSRPDQDPALTQTPTQATLLEE